MSTLGQFFAAGGETARFERVFAASGSFTCPVAGKYLVTAIGGGGGGGGKGASIATNGGGGGAGGMAQKVITLAANDVITYTIGAGGAGGAAGSNPGSTGGTTTVTATGLSLTANGGGGGAASISVSGAATPGGTASGGTINVTGGEGSGYYIGVGYGGPGGTVGIYGISYSSHISGAVAAAGVGGPPSGAWPGTAIMSGADLITIYGSTPPSNGTDPGWANAARSMMFESIYGGNLTGGTSYLSVIGGYSTQSGRFLQPRGGIISNQGGSTTLRYYPGPGCGGWPLASGSVGGAFCGSANTYTGSGVNGSGGGIGGGGGSGGGGGDTTSRSGGAGGQGLVVIEWFAPI